MKNLFIKLLFSISVTSFILPDIAYGQLADREITALPIEIPRLLKEKDTVVISFIGDVMQHGKQLKSALIPGKDPDSADSYDYSHVFKYIGEQIGNSDITVANMEFPVGVPPYSGYPEFSAPVSIAEEAVKSGIDLFLIANNHLLDKGEKGIRRTIELYDSLGANYTGAYRDSLEEKSDNPKILVVNGVKIAFLNFTYGTNGIPVPYPYRVNSTDTLEIKEAILRAKADSADIIIALPHWGTEYRLKHDHAQERLAEWLVSNGADLVIGTHPHVPQDRDTVGGRHVIYSLGNFISNMSLANTQAGLAAKIKIVKRYGHKARIDSAECIYLWCSRQGYKEKGFTTVIINEMEGKRQEWLRGNDYDNMINSRNRIRKIINIR